MTKIFESHKKVTATAMNRLDYTIYRGWELPADENGTDEGYLVEYLDGGKPNHPKHKGYISWSPKAQFDNGYTEVKSDEAKLEQKIQTKGLNAPRLTPTLIDETIKDKTFHVFGDTCLTVCCLTLQNGFTVTGESACASPENFNKEIGESIAFNNARDKIWALEGYLLKEILYTSENNI